MSDQQEHQSWEAAEAKPMPVAAEQGAGQQEEDDSSVPFPTVATQPRPTPPQEPNG